MKVIECINLTKEFKEGKALDNLSFTIENQKITALIGRNGAGKTTLLKSIAGLLKPSSGSISVLSHSPFNNLMVSANMIMIDEYMTFPTSLNLKEILNSAKSFYPQWNHELAVRLMEYFSISPKQYHSSLSKGMKSTFNVIFGMATRCPITIFDEPTSGMDAAVRKDFYRALLKDYIAYPRTILLSSHHLNEIDHLIEDVLLIDSGKLIVHMPVSELKELAIGIKGHRSTVDKWVENKELYFSREIGSHFQYAVVKNDLSEFDLQTARQMGLEISNLTVADLCVYLTNKSSGGIDNVFN